MRTSINSRTLTFRELRDGFVHVLETSKNIGQAGGCPEILLFEAKFFPNFGSITVHEPQMISI
jgi:hypothetical protein